MNLYSTCPWHNRNHTNKGSMDSNKGSRVISTFCSVVLIRVSLSEPHINRYYEKITVSMYVHTMQYTCAVLCGRAHGA